MNNNLSDVLPIDSPMLYYQLPNIVKRRCRALKNISLEQEQLDITLRESMRQVCSKYSNVKPQTTDVPQRPFASPFDLQSLNVVKKKANDLKQLVGETASKAARLNTDSSNLDSGEVREVLDRCESKCKEVLTHLANIDWELYEFEESLSLYQADVENAMTEYNMKLNNLYKRRLGLIRGEFEPTEDDCTLPEYLNFTNPPKYWETERDLEVLFSIGREDSELAIMLKSHRVLGVPRFWLQSLLIALRQVEVIEVQDYSPLEYLADIRYYYDTNRDCFNDDLKVSNHKTQVLLFYFDKNPYFTNRILSKTLHIDRDCHLGKRMFDGLWVSNVEGCDINWNEGHDMTRKPQGVRRQTTSGSTTADESTINKQTANSGMVLPYRQSRRRQRLPCKSFFNFFSSRGFNYGKKVMHYNDVNQLVEVELDYDVFVRFRDFIVPHAIIAYSRGNLFGFECERINEESISEKLHYLNTLFEAPTTDH